MKSDFYYKKNGKDTPMKHFEVPKGILNFWQREIRSYHYICEFSFKGFAQKRVHSYIRRNNN